MCLTRPALLEPMNPPCGGRRVTFSAVSLVLFTVMGLGCTKSEPPKTTESPEVQTSPATSNKNLRDEVTIIEEPKPLPKPVYVPLRTVLTGASVASAAERETLLTRAIWDRYQALTQAPNLKSVVKNPSCIPASTSLTLTHRTDGTPLSELIVDEKVEGRPAALTRLVYEDENLVLRIDTSTGEDPEHHFFFEERQIACRASAAIGPEATACALRFNAPRNKANTGKNSVLSKMLPEMERQHERAIRLRPLRAFLGDHLYSTGLAERCTNQKAVIAQIKKDFAAIKKPADPGARTAQSFSLECRANLVPCKAEGEVIPDYHTVFQKEPILKQVDTVFDEQGTGFIAVKARVLDFTSGDERSLKQLGYISNHRTELYFKHGLPFFFFDGYEQATAEANPDYILTQTSETTRESRHYLRVGEPVLCLRKDNGSRNAIIKCSESDVDVWDARDWLYEIYLSQGLNAYFRDASFEACLRDVRELRDDYESECFDAREEAEEAQWREDWERTIDAETMCMEGYEWCGSECIPDHADCEQWLAGCGTGKYLCITEDSMRCVSAKGPPPSDCIY